MRTFMLSVLLGALAIGCRPQPPPAEKPPAPDPIIDPTDPVAEPPILDGEPVDPSEPEPDAGQSGPTAPPTSTAPSAMMTR